MNYRIGTRGSPLALWQARRVAELLRGVDSSSHWEICVIKTSGDARSEFGDELPEGVGEFSSALEKELLSGGIDLAVHSAKDVPTCLPEGLTLAAFPERADARDAVVRRKESPALPPVGSRLGTGSPRRSLLWAEKWPQTEIHGIRGNVDRRMGRLQKEKEWWGVILACAGIDRLGGVPEGLAMERLDPKWMVPAPGQGALAIECRETDLSLRKILEKINCLDVQICVEAEKAFLRTWGGGCAESLGAYAQLTPQGDLILRVAVKGKRGQVVRGGAEGRADQAITVGSELAEKIRSE